MPRDPDRIIIAGSDGTCPCGLCHCKGYADLLSATDDGLAVGLVVEPRSDEHDPTYCEQDLTLGVYQPTPKMLELAFSDNRVIRATFALGSLIAIERSETIDG